jgi:hypothetical protein
MITQIKYPSRVKGLMMAVLFSVLAHAAILLAIRIAPIVSIAMGFSGVEFVDETYNKKVLINPDKWLIYPYAINSGNIGSRPSQKTSSLDEMKKEEARRKKEEARRKRERELAEKREAEERAKAEEKARAEMANAEPKPTPTPKPDSGYGSFGKINTAPIKDQIQRLYQAKKDGKLRIPDGKFTVGVTGTINPDGSLADYNVHIPSGIPEIDDSAMAILAAVSESRALGPLSKLKEITMVLDIDQEARLTVVGFTSTETDANNLHNLADIAVFAAKRTKGNDPTAMVMLNNLVIKHTGNRIQAVIKVPKEMAKETLARSMDK